jgi:hypothetical protein
LVDGAGSGKSARPVGVFREPPGPGLPPSVEGPAATAGAASDRDGRSCSHVSPHRVNAAGRRGPSRRVRDTLSRRDPSAGRVSSRTPGRFRFRRAREVTAACLLPGRTRGFEPRRAHCGGDSGGRITASSPALGAGRCGFESHPPDWCDRQAASGKPLIRKDKSIGDEHRLESGGGAQPLGVRLPLLPLPE